MDAQQSYGPIEPTAVHVQLLHHHAHPISELKKAGYIFGQLSSADLERKKRCEKCSKVLKKERRQKQPDQLKLPLAPVVAGAKPEGHERQTVDDTATVADSQARTKSGHSSKNAASLIGHAQDPKSKVPQFYCKYHPGRVQNRKWTCCNGPPFSSPCSGQDEHSPRRYRTGELEKNWQLYETEATPLPTHVLAVVLDCEMGTTSSGESELIRISMVDFYTGAVLINSLVYPNVRMAHYNARFSGVTKQDMEEARRRNKCILGRDAARKAVYKYVGPNTVVIGHAGHQDLTSLRWTHRRIVDTLILETRKRLLDEDNAQRKEWEDVERREIAEPAAPSCNVGDEGDNAAANPQRGGLSLKALTLEKLNRVIQVKGRGHDSLEDALATRDLLHWHISAVLESSPPEGSS